MSPILGIGLAIGTTDREMLYHANKNFGIAVFISFATSVVYFLITPLGQPQPEMFARTEPTLLDVGVAFLLEVHLLHLTVPPEDGHRVGYELR